MATGKKGKGSVGFAVNKQGFIRITTTGLKQTQRELQQSVTNMADFTKVMNVGAVDLMRLIDDSFHHQRDPAGVPWEILDDSTVEARIRNLMFGRTRNRKHHGVSSRSGGIMMKTQREKAAETRAKSRKLSAKKHEKAAAYRSKMKILVDTGRLRNSWWAKAYKKGIRFGTNVKYAAVHQMGGKDITARMMAPIEFVGGKWRLIERGPAKVYFDRLRNNISRYAMPNGVSPNGTVTKGR